MRRIVPIVMVAVALALVTFNLSDSGVRALSICTGEPLDADEDCLNDVGGGDTCPGTPLAEPHDSYGCAASQIDNPDGDTFCDDPADVPNDTCWAVDNCPGTPPGELPPDSYGCGPSQVDEPDNDQFCNDGDPTNDFCFGADDCDSVADDGNDADTGPSPNLGDPFDGCPDVDNDNFVDPAHLDAGLVAGYPLIDDCPNEPEDQVGELDGCPEPTTEGPFGDPTCSDGIDNDRDGDTDEDDSDCAPPPSLTITKVCPNGGGDGDADFNVLVRHGATLVDFDSLDCNEDMLIVGLAPGDYTIQELITGPSAGKFTTSIVCDGVETAGTFASVTLVDEDLTCLVINTLDLIGGETPPSPPAPGPGIDIDNTNTNTLNNDNLNTNNNENTNTQTQSNEQTQTNDNNQTTTVNSSPSVVIDFD